MSIVCETPVGITPESAHAKYLQMKKEMPGLTPAAWRKAAAQSLGMDYKDYLAIWKQKKSASKATKLVADPLPTTPAATQPGPAMNIPTKPSLSQVSTATKDFDEALDGMKTAYIKGDLDYDDVKDITNDLFVEYGKILNKQVISAKIQHTKVKMVQGKQAAKAASDDAAKAATATKQSDTAVGMSDKFHDEAMNHIMTSHGPLNHGLAQTTYKAMKKQMPGGTPAQWRHAASEYLGVDYSDYLAAWKKPGAAASKSKKIIDGTPNVTTPTSAAPQGKYGGKYITQDQVKDELAKAYGAGAQKQYINVTYNSIDDVYSVQFPNSLFPTQAAKDAVAARLRSLGLEVKPGYAGHYNISANTVKKVAEQKKAFSGSGHTKTVTLPDGRVVWDQDAARDWSNSWYRTLTSTQQSAVKNYTASGYRSINSGLRGGRSATPTADALSDAMEAMDHSFTVFRGTDIPINQFVKGELWSDAGFMSTAIGPGSAWQGVKFEIRVTPGIRGAYVDPVSSHVGEREFILDKGTQFRVMEVDEFNRKVVLVAIPK